MDNFNALHEYIEMLAQNNTIPENDYRVLSNQLQAIYRLIPQTLINPRINIEARQAAEEERATEMQRAEMEREQTMQYIKAFMEQKKALPHFTFSRELIENDTLIGWFWLLRIFLTSKSLQQIETQVKEVNLHVNKNIPVHYLMCLFLQDLDTFLDTFGKNNDIEVHNDIRKITFNKRPAVKFYMGHFLLKNRFTFFHVDLQKALKCVQWLHDIQQEENKNKQMSNNEAFIELVLFVFCNFGVNGNHKIFPEIYFDIGNYLLLENNGRGRQYEYAITTYNKFFPPRAKYLRRYRKITVKNYTEYHKIQLNMFGLTMSLRTALFRLGYINFTELVKALYYVMEYYDKVKQSCFPELILGPAFENKDSQSRWKILKDGLYNTLNDVVKKEDRLYCWSELQTSGVSKQSKKKNQSRSYAIKGVSNNNISLGDINITYE